MGERAKARSTADDFTAVHDIDEDPDVVPTTNLNDVTQQHSIVMNNSSKPDRFKIVVKPPLALEFTDDKEADIHRTTALLTQAIEAAIREHPTQWLWIHNRWKHRPPEEAAAPLKDKVIA